MTQRHRVRPFAWTAAAAVVAAAGITLVAGMTPSVAVPPTNSAAHDANTEFANSLSNAFRSSADRVLPSVVTIQKTAAVEQLSSREGAPQGENQIPEEMLKNPFFKRFFEDMPEMRQFKSPRMPRGRQHQSGMGSGVIIDKSGLILTNNHVVEGAGKVVVRLHDGREFEATDVKTDPSTDIAIVRIEGAGDLPAAAIGDSSKLDIGDWVIAVGAPFGLQESVTAGIVSAKSRGIGITDREDFIQTDAAINPGNSGGPLVNLNGEVIGINTAIHSRSGGYEGIGFAIPINLAQWVSSELASHGTVQRAFLGVAIQQVTPDLSKQFGLTTIGGALVTEVRPGTPAEKAGMQAGDVIVGFGKSEVHNPRELQSSVERTKVGSQETVTVMRDGKKVTLDVTVDRLPAEELAAAATPDQPKKESAFEDIGVEISNLEADVAEQLGMKGAQGVLITGVTAGSPAEQAGLSDGMVIQKVGQTKITNVEEFRTAMKDQKLEDGVLILVRTQGGSRFLVLKK